MVMFDIDVCYKFIFESMLENTGVDHIAEKVNDYTRAGVFFVLKTGEILACACDDEEKDLRSVKEGYVVLEDYQRYCPDRATDKKLRRIFAVCPKKERLGYVVLTFCDAKDGTFFEKLGELLAQTCGTFYEEKQKKIIMNQSFRECILGRTLLTGDKKDVQELKDLYAGKYVAALFPKTDGQTGRELLKITGVWSYCVVYEDEQSVTAVYYRLDNTDEIYEKLIDTKLECCVSEAFSEIGCCHSKRMLLESISQVETLQIQEKVRREKEWYLSGIYRYAAPLIKEAGLVDYSVLRLIEEDRRNHTELYDTLKNYLLCENNVKRTAEKMHIHRNTLAYRLRQIRDCIHKDINDNEISRELLAFMMMYDISR